MITQNLFAPKFRCEPKGTAWHRTTRTHNYHALSNGLPVTFDETMSMALDHC